jgi:7-cyano-7-deazaguanine reductase
LFRQGTSSAGRHDALNCFTSKPGADTSRPLKIEWTAMASEKDSKEARKSSRRLTAAKGGAAPSLRQLGRVTEPPASPEAALLETAPNPQSGALFLARFTAPEFTSLCPVTGQPDFAHLVIDYAPAKKLVESKSLKLFLASFRNHGAFHEDCTVMIARRMVAAARPHWLRIAGYWYPRGGIPIDVFYQTGEPPEGLWIPDTGVPPYRGRG